MLDIRRLFHGGARSVLALTCLLADVSGLHGALITYITGEGALTSGNPISASATFTTAEGCLLLTITDLLTDPKDVTQAVSGLEFVLSNGATTGTLISSSAQEITVNKGGMYGLGSTVLTDWSLINSLDGGLELQDLGFAGPRHLIIGPPGPDGLYDKANGSIAGNGAHNSFLNQTAAYYLAVGGVTEATMITSVKFSFGTTPGANTVAGMVASAERSSAGMLLVGSVLLGIWKSRKSLGPK